MPPSAVKRCVELSGVSQRELETLLGLEEGVLEIWEKGEAAVPLAASILLWAVAKDPSLLRLSGASAGQWSSAPVEMVADSPVWPRLDGEFELPETGEEERRVLFNPPVKVVWWTVPEESDRENLVVEVGLENSMSWVTRFSPEARHPAARLELHPSGSVTPVEVESSVKRMLAFEFVHSFFHPEIDPNYGLLNWALYGNFRERVALSDTAAVPEYVDAPPA